MRKQRISTEMPSPSHPGSNQDVPQVSGGKVSCLSKPAPSLALPCPIPAHHSRTPLLTSPCPLMPFNLSLSHGPLLKCTEVHHYCPLQIRPKPNPKPSLELIPTLPHICLFHFMAKLRRGPLVAGWPEHDTSLLQPSHPLKSPSGETTVRA